MFLVKMDYIYVIRIRINVNILNCEINGSKGLIKSLLKKENFLHFAMQFNHVPLFE